jgi:hypothetical protein
VTLRAVRLVVVAVCVGGIAGMIVSSIVGSTGAAVTFGLITAGAVLCSIVATAVGAGPGGSGSLDETEAALVERLIVDLVQAGADETEVRNLVRHAVRLGRTSMVTDKT